MLPIPIPLKIISYFTPSDIVALCIAVQFFLLLIFFTYLLIKSHRLDSFKFHRVKTIYPHEIKSTIIKHNEYIIIMHDYFKLTSIFFCINYFTHWQLSLHNCVKILQNLSFNRPLENTMKFS